MFFCIDKPVGRLGMDPLEPMFTVKTRMVREIPTPFWKSNKAKGKVRSDWHHPIVLGCSGILCPNASPSRIRNAWNVQFLSWKKNACKFFRWHWVFPSPNQQSADLPIGGCRLCSHSVALSPQLLSLLRKGLVPADYGRVDVQLKLRVNDLLVCLVSSWI